VRPGADKFEPDLVASNSAQSKSNSGSKISHVLAGFQLAEGQLIQDVTV
jgi:hypothetical protein